MAGQPGNAWTLAFGKQTAKGTPNTTPSMKLRYTGGFGPSPVRNFITLAETDAIRQQGDPVVVGTRVEGSSEHYIRPAEFHRIADAHLGSTATTGAGPNYTHTSSSTAAGSTPYVTLYKALASNVLVDRYQDCQINSLTCRGGAEQALTASLDWLGLVALLGQTDPAGTPVSQNPLVYPHVTVTLGGSATGIVDSFEVTSNQGKTLIIGDTGLTAADTAAGLYAVSGSLSILFENQDDYREFHTGTAAGTSPGTTIAGKTLNITAAIDANTSVAWDMDDIVIESYPVEGNTDGSPLRVAMGFRSRRGAALANVLEIITKNQTAGPV